MPPTDSSLPPGQADPWLIFPDCISFIHVLACIVFLHCSKSTSGTVRLSRKYCSETGLGFGPPQGRSIPAGYVGRRKQSLNCPAVRHLDRREYPDARNWPGCPSVKVKLYRRATMDRTNHTGKAPASPREYNLYFCLETQRQPASARVAPIPPVLLNLYSARSSSLKFRSCPRADEIVPLSSFWNRAIRSRRAKAGRARVGVGDCRSVALDLCSKVNAVFTTEGVPCPGNEFLELCVVQPTCTSPTGHQFLRHPTPLVPDP